MYICSACGFQQFGTDEVRNTAHAEFFPDHAPKWELDTTSAVVISPSELDQILTNTNDALDADPGKPAARLMEDCYQSPGRLGLVLEQWKTLAMLMTFATQILGPDRATMLATNIEPLSTPACAALYFDDVTLADTPTA